MEGIPSNTPQRCGNDKEVIEITMSINTLATSEE
jgi:hypothetical protein